MGKEPPKSLLLINGRFHRNAFDDDPASALLVEGGDIAWIGDRADAPAADGTLDLDGACVLPGLTDAHIHVFTLALARLQLGFARHRPDSIAHVISLLREEAGRIPPHDWVQGLELNEDQLREGRLPTRDELDAAFPDRPVLLRRYCGHVAVFNSAAMRALGLSETEADPASGHFERFTDGTVNGIAFERAAEAIFRAAPAPSQAALATAMREVMTECLQLGLTALTEAAVGFSLGYDREAVVWDFLRAEGPAPVRMGFMAQLTAEEAETRGLHPRFDRDWSQESLKMFADGIVGGRTSALSEPFCDRGGCGSFMLPEAQLRDDILAAHAAGWRIAVHATGDRAIDLVARAYADARPIDPGRRNRIEHCFCPPDGLFEKLCGSGSMVVMQPSFLWRMGASIEAGLGDRTATAYPGRSVLAAGADLVLSSDAPTGLLSPWAGMHSAVNRQAPTGSILGADEALSARQAVDGYVGGGARAMRHEDFRGCLVPGLAADLTVLDRDPFTCSPDELASIGAVLTMTRGEVVHDGR